MKTTLSMTCLLGIAITAGCKKSEPETIQPGPSATAPADAAKPKDALLVVAKEVEAGCAMCIYGMADASCELAVKIDDKVYLVEGSKLDDHGDAHAPNGMCMMARQAYVEGRIAGDKFVADKVELKK